MFQIGSPLFNYTTAILIVMELLVLGIVVFGRRQKLQEQAKVSNALKVTIVLLRGQLYFSPAVLFLLCRQNLEWVHLSITELTGLYAVSQLILVASFLIQFSKNKLHDSSIRISAQFFLSIVLSVSMTLLAFPAAPMSVDYLGLTFWLLPAYAVLLALNYLVNTLKSAFLVKCCYFLSSAVYFTVHSAVLFHFSFDIAPFDVEMDHGLDAIRLLTIMSIMTTLSVCLAVTIGNDPRQHWRRYMVAATLVALSFASIFVLTGFTMRHMNDYFELARLIEKLDAKRLELYIDQRAYNESLSHSDGKVEISPEVFDNIQEYADTRNRIARLLRNPSMDPALQDNYFGTVQRGPAEAGQGSLDDQILLILGSIKSTFGLQSKVVTLQGNQTLNIERQLNDFAENVLIHGRQASETQMLIRDVSISGGFFTLVFMVFGVFIPAHKSTVSTLDALEDEKERAEKLALCAEHTTKGIALTDAAGCVTWCNDAFSRITGYGFDILEGQKLIEILRHRNSGTDDIRRIREGVKLGESVSFESVVRSKDGDAIWLRGTVTPILEEGWVSQCVHVFEDITAKRSMEEKLQQAMVENERLALIARQATDGMALLKADYTLLWVNPAMERMTGRSFDELKQMSFQQALFGPKTDTSKLREMVEALRNRRHFVSENMVYNKSGGTYYIEAIHTPVFDESGVFSGYILTHRDITERKELELELIANRDDLAARVEERTQTIVNQALELEKALDKERELNQMQSEFLSIASHEFRTPLTIIDGVARRLEKKADKLKPEEICERSSTIRSTVKRMTMLIERTLDASRMSSGRIRLTPGNFNLKELVEEICARQIELAPGHTIDVELDNVPDELFGDAKLLDNVFTNVVSNAVKYSGERKYVRITGGVDSDFAYITARDHGVGIPADEIAKICQRFFRARTSTGISGTGIGLNLVKSLVEMHSGQFEITSEEGEWTEVTVRLPLVSPLDSAAGETAPDLNVDIDQNAQMA